jgi:arginase
MKKISLIPYSCGFGADNRGCEDGPDALRNSDFKELLKERGVSAIWLDKIVTNNENSDNLANVTNCCKNLKKQVGDVLGVGGFPVTIGGDHSMAVGTWNGVANSLNVHGKLGLIWIDAHMDAHTFASSPTGNIHGMPLSYLLGYGNDSLAELTKNEAVISPNNLCLIGIRSFESGEEKLLKELGVRVFRMDEVLKQGLDVVMKQALEIVSKSTVAFGISVDIDAFDPEIAPGTGTLEKGGIKKGEFINAIKNSLPEYKDKFVALEIAEYNPHMDKNNITVDLIADIAGAIIIK